MSFPTQIWLIPQALILVLFSACGSSSVDDSISNTGYGNWSIEELADEVLAATMNRYPSMPTFYSIKNSRHDRLFDNSLKALTVWQVKEDEWLARLNALGEPQEIGSRDWVTYGILRESLEAARDTRICRKELWETSTTTAWYTSLPFIFDIQPLDSEELKNEALQRLEQVDNFIDTEIENLKLGLSQGYSSPRVTVEAVPSEARALLDENSPFLAIGVRANDDSFKEKVQNIFDEEIAPAIHRFADFIEEDYLDKARNEISISFNPNGSECYPALVRSFLTIQPSADQIHELGLQQIKKIRGEMEAILNEHYSGESIEKFLRRMNLDEEFTFTSEEEVVQYSRDALDTARKEAAKVFGLMPKADVEIKPYPEFAASGVGEYHSSSEDGTRPGIFYIAVKDPTHRSRASQLSTLYHETYPGHHLQGAIALELGNKVHSFVRYTYNAGYSEGWGLYSERLAQELNLYKNSLDLMGMLSDQAARAVRLVIDSGIHTKGWTRQQSIDYMLNNTGWAKVDIENDINRYISWPAQANAYMLGMLEIRRLRDFSERELADNFDLSGFHDRILENGSMTLPMTEKAILSWVAKENFKAKKQ
ncbi:MAG: DUF885 domain-containing protein [Porticoccaceae bacterium]|nr:DUF885 domain-containing protein [Porticoccaceae bacterium]